LCCESAISLYNQWADLEARSSNYERALDLLLHSLGVNPEWPPTHYQLGTVHVALGQFDEAEAEYRRSMELCATMWQACLDLSETLIISGKPEDARLYVEEFVRGQPHIWRGRFLLARVYLALGLTQAAQEQATAALSLAPEADQAEIQRLIDFLR